MVSLFGDITNIQSASNTQLQVTFSFGYYDSVAVTNVNRNGITANVTKPGTITVLALNQAIADAIIAYVNSNFGTSFTRSETAIAGGFIPLAL